MIWLRDIERACALASALALVAMVVIIVTDVVTRNFLGFSFQISDEFGGYLLVAATFMAMPVAAARGAFHQVAFLQMRLPERARLAVEATVHAISLAVCLIMEWQIVRFVMINYRSGDAAPTQTGTPLWIPQLAMPIGMGLLCLMLFIRVIRAIDEWRSYEGADPRDGHGR